MGRSVTLSAVGDINLGDRAMMVGLGVRSQICKDSTFDPFGSVTRIISDSDLSFGNLECVLSDYGIDNTRVESRMMRAAPKSVHLIRKSGFNLLSIANNHIMQHGNRCFRDTVRNLLVEGILPIGVAGLDERCCIPRFITSNGLKFCFIGYCLRPEKYTYPPLYAQGDIVRILEEIKIFRHQCEFLIVSLHWGEEYMDYPAAWQVEAAHGMIDQGASVILGHHPHVLQGVEKYNGGVIAYSLGNFIFDVWQKKLRESMVLQITFTKMGIKYVKKNPVYITSKFAPRPLLVQEENNMIEKSILLDKKLSRIQVSAVPDDTYLKEAGTAERINQLQNRLLFLWQLPRYEKDVAKQCLSNFMRSRIKG